MKVFCLFFCLISSAYSYLSAQVIATTEDGSKVILYIDGQWEFLPTDPMEQLKGDSCRYLKKGIDSVSGLPKVVLMTDSLFKYTPADQLEKWAVAGKSYVDGNAYLTNMKNKKYVYFNFTIQSSQANSLYGSLEIGKQLLVMLDNGKNISLRLASSTNGNADYKKDLTTYTVYCELPDNKIAELQTTTAKKIRFYFSNGYQDYDVNNKDFFIKYLPCIK